MIKHTLSLVLFSLVACFPLAADASRIEAFFIYQGDKHGDFRGDTVVMLNDRSVWKVHPAETFAISKWRTGDTVRVSLRSESYAMKREHKFLLVNESLGETAKVMLVDHGLYALCIVDTSAVYPIEQTVVPIYDEKGQVCNYTYINKGEEKVLHLSDGSVWLIHDAFNIFKTGVLVHPGCKESQDSAFTFLITGLEREACWTKANRDRR